MRSLLPLLLVLPVVLATASPAHAVRNRIAAFLELTWTVNAPHDPLGLGVGAELVGVPAPRRTPPPRLADVTLGASLRARLHGDGRADLTLESIVGVTAGHNDRVCAGRGTRFNGSLDGRAGLTLRSRGGPGLSLGSAVTGEYTAFLARTHASAVLPFRPSASHPSSASPLQDATLAVGLGLSANQIGCSVPGLH